MWCGAGYRLPPPTADSKCFVISGQQLSKVLHTKAEQLRREYLLVTRTLTHVTATVLHRQWARSQRRYKIG